MEVTTIYHSPGHPGGMRKPENHHRWHQVRVVLLNAVKIIEWSPRSLLLNTQLPSEKNNIDSARGRVKHVSGCVSQRGQAEAVIFYVVTRLTML